MRKPILMIRTTRNKAKIEKNNVKGVFVADVTQ